MVITHKDIKYLRSVPERALAKVASTAHTGRLPP